MNSDRTSRLAHQLLSRQAVHYDVATKERLVFRNRSRALRKYSGQDNIFGSFTDIPKLGVNPQTTYNTPIGVYSYPLDYILGNAFEHVFTVPFAADAQYLHIFSVSGIDRTLQFDRNDTDKIHEFRSDAPDDFESEEYSEVKDLVLRVNNYVNSTLAEIPENYWTDDARKVWERWFEKLQGVTDWDYYDPDDEVSYAIMTIGGVDRYQVNRILSEGKFPLDRVLEHIQNTMIRAERSKTLIFPYEDRILKLPEVQQMGMEAYAKFKNDVILGEGQRIACDQAFAWNCTRHLSGLNQVKWTGLMRNMGLIGAVDHGTGTIHENEPTQAVFFNPSSIKVLEVIHNTEPTRSGISYTSGAESFSTWAADTERYMLDAVRSFRLSLRRYLTVGSRSNQQKVFAGLSWLSQHAREFFKEYPTWVEDFMEEIDTRREKPHPDTNEEVLNKITQILQRFLR